MSRRARLLVLALGGVFIAGAGVAGWLLTNRESKGAGYVETYVGNVSIVYPAAYARFAAGRLGGRSDGLELAATLPDLKPAGDIAVALGQGANARKAALMFISIGRADRKVDPADLVAQLYARFLDEKNIVETEEGLVKRSFQDGSPYAGEELYFDAPEGRVFAARCPRPRVPPDDLPETCIATFRQATSLGALDIDYRFDRAMLAQWEQLSEGSRALVRSMLAR
jgi:hypothetical protein